MYEKDFSAFCRIMGQSFPKNLLVIFAIIAVLAILFCVVLYDYRCGLHFPTRAFEDNRRNEPYSQNIPLHEMDFEVYSRYLPVADALAYADLDTMIVLPCDVDYYTDKEDSVPALTLKKGTEICVTPGKKGFSISLTGYGLECWPDYQEDWRYGCPFITEDTDYIVAEHPMYYVKSSQLEKVAGAFCKANRKLIGRFSTPWDYPRVVTRQIDRYLYSGGVYCPKRWKK